MKTVWNASILEGNTCTSHLAGLDHKIHDAMAVLGSFHQMLIINYVVAEACFGMSSHE
jgi:hypothetical protein